MITYKSDDGIALDRDNLFTDKHRIAVLQLVTLKHLKPVDAIAAISRLSGYEALMIAEFYDVGLTNQMIINERERQFSISASNWIPSGYQNALKFLVRKHKLTVTNAMAELFALNREQITVLLNFYDFGVRSIDLQPGASKAGCKQYDELATKTVYRRQWFFDVQIPYAVNPYANYYSRLFHENVKSGMNPHAAIENCLRAILWVGSDIDKTKFLNKHLNDGVRYLDLHNMSEIKKTFNVLHMRHRLPVKAALAEMSGLSAVKTKFLREHYRDGVRKQHLVEITDDHLLYANVVMRAFKLTAIEAITIVSELDIYQLSCLQEFSLSGLTLEQAKSLKLTCEIRDDKRDVALFLVHEKNYNIVDAINMVASKSSQELVELTSQNVTRSHAP